MTVYDKMDDALLHLKTKATDLGQNAYAAFWQDPSGEYQSHRVKFLLKETQECVELLEAAIADFRQALAELEQVDETRT